MIGFVSKPIMTSQTIGERFYKVRLANNVTIPAAAKATGIKAKYLLAIEAGQYSELPGEIYAREFVKTYARFLNLNPQDAAAEYFLEKQSQDLVLAQKTKAHWRNHWLIFLRNVFSYFHGWRKAISLAILIIAFSYYFFPWSSLTLPEIIIIAPEQYFVAQDSAVIVAGQAKRAAELYLNNSPLAMDKQGNFKETLNLPAGFTLLKLEARDRFGRTRIVWRSINVPSDPKFADAKAMMYYKIVISGLRRLDAIQGANEERNKPYCNHTALSTAVCDEEVRQTRKS